MQVLVSKLLSIHQHTTVAMIFPCFTLKLCTIPSLSWYCQVTLLSSLTMYKSWIWCTKCSMKLLNVVEIINIANYPLLGLCLVASDSIVVAKQLTSFGLQSASNRCHHQMVAFLFFLSLWITLVVIGAFPLLLFLVSLNSIGSVELSTPLFGLLLCAASTLAGAFGLLSCVITPIEINRLTQFLQEMTMLCHAQ